MSEPIKNLICSCCGGATKGRQWFNRDKGYGLCNGCIDLCTRNETKQSAQSIYGVSGIHYNLE